MRIIVPIAVRHFMLVQANTVICSLSLTFFPIIKVYTQTLILDAISEKKFSASQK